MVGAKLLTPLAVKELQRWGFGLGTDSKRRCGSNVSD